MTTEELRAWLALWRVPGIGPLRFWQLLLRFPNLVEIFKTPQALTSLKLPEKIRALIKQPDWLGVDRDLQWADAPEHHIITWFDSRYPPQLKQIHDAPPLLFVHGDPEVLSRAQLAIVGSRRPTPMGLETAREFSKTLASAGICITSGLALGIDGAAHQGALHAKSPTIAVLACGLDQVYPKQHQTLACQISAQGALVSEFPIGVLPLSAHFPRRNRLVSGLSLGVLVIEAGLRSGSLITARLAAEQGREVFAIPGSIRNLQTGGCHLLIQQGAKLVTAFQDILEELPNLRAHEPTGGVASTAQTQNPNLMHNVLAESDRLLLECIGYEPTSLDQIVDRSGLQIQQAAAKILKLELDGLITAVDYRYIKLR